MKHNFQYHLSREIRAIRMLHGVTPQFFPIVTLNAIVKAVLPYATVFLSARILTELATMRRPNILWKWVIVTIFVTGLLSVLRSFFMEREETLLNDIYGRKELLFSEKAMSMDFADADKQEVRSLRAQISQNEQWGGLGLINAAIIYKELIGSLTGIFSGIALTVRLFATPVPESAGKLVLLSSPWFLLPLGGLFVGISLLSGRFYTVYAQEYDRLSKDATFGNRVYTYITKLSRQKNIQMDMRIYRQQKIIDALSAQNQVFTAKGIFGRAALGKPGLCWSVAASSATLTVGCIYVFTCLKAWAGAFDIGLVTQYVGAATALAESLNILISSLGSMKANTTHLDNTFRYLDLPNAMYQGSLIQLAGGQNAAGELEGDYWTEISYESLLAMAPEVIILPSAASYTVEDILNDAQLAGVPAVEEGRVYQMPGQVEEWDSPVHSGILGALWLTSTLHPESYSQEEFVADAQDFYREFYGFELDAQLLTA